MLDMTGRVAIITGGGTGIGAATARLFAAQGADVVIAARTVEDLEAVSKEVEAASGRRCLAVPTDVKNEEAVVNLIKTTVDTFGRIDVLVNNAGGTRMGPLTGITTKAWDSSFDLNVKSAYFCTREAGPYLMESKGAIVNISSAAGINGVKGGAHYSSSKAALQMFTKVTAAEWGPHGVRANCIAVGMVASERAVDAWKVAGLDQSQMGKDMPLRRPGRPDEVAKVILFFATDQSSFVTGQTIAVDGGPPMGGIKDA